MYIGKIREQILSGKLISDAVFLKKIFGKYPIMRKRTKGSLHIPKKGTGISAQLGRPLIKILFWNTGTDEINAFAAPGGYIFVTKGALKLMGMKHSSQGFGSRAGTY
ncbi:MAG: hypothetical protein Ct9H300mP21_05350 [Pseudomonadota bacterium]|nr:MAG: hypothetical protein Ct9H300mP21_05350 [Pseudomonadota bacterium]